jgi:hypothetical protein
MSTEHKTTVAVVRTAEERRIAEEKRTVFTEEEDLGLRSPNSFASNTEALPAPVYHDEEHFTRPVDSPKDIITEVIHAKDDPTLNPWTFRTWFIGKTVPYSLQTESLFTVARSRTGRVRICTGPDLLLQATDNVCIRRFPVTGCIRPRECVGNDNPKDRFHWKMVQSTPSKLQLTPLVLVVGRF